MIYIIDANNLAGKLELLEEDNFDKILISRIKKYFVGKKIEVVLVFDSADFMGDRINDGMLEIVYTPKDDFYHCADDKVLEIVGNYLNDDDFKEEIIVVTDDIELKEKVWEKIKESKEGRRVKILEATKFAEKMPEREDIIENDDWDSFSKREVSNLNDELLKKWGNG